MQIVDEHKTKNIFRDLNLLRVLDALIKTQSVTRAGETLSLSQPATSRNVAKLRRLLSDPLLVRTSKGYVLTPLAESLREEVVSALSQCDRVFSSAQFDPKISSRVFKIGTTDYGALTVVAPFASKLMKLSPSSQLQVEPWTDETLLKLESGELDFALYADDELPPDFHYKPLFEESYSVIARTGHPFMKQKYKTTRSLVEQLAKEKHFTAIFPSGRIFKHDNIFERLGGKSEAHSTLSMPYFTLGPLAVAQSDLIMIVPNRLAQIFSKHYRIEILQITEKSENFSYRIVWHERAQRDLGNKWMRNEFAQQTSK